MTIWVTGGAGFIGGNFVLDWVASSDEQVINLDKLTYAGNLETLSSLQGKVSHIFLQGDIGDRTLVEHLLAENKPRAVINFAAESHGVTPLTPPKSTVSSAGSLPKPLSLASVRRCSGTWTIPGGWPTCSRVNTVSG